MCLEGGGKHLSFKGLRKIGKSELAKYYIATHPKQQLAYIDLENLNLTVELFPQEYVGTICFWYFNKGMGFVEEFHNPFNVIKKINDPLVTSTMTGILQELEKKSPNYKLMMEYALNFPEQLSSRDDTTIGIFIDEFQLFMELSGKFDITRLLRSIVQNQHRTRYVALGSWMTKFDELFADAASPLFLHFALESLPNFSRDDSFEFLLKYFNRFEITLTKEMLDNMYGLCHGHPMYLNSLADRLLLLNSTGMDMDKKSVKMAFLTEITSKNGMINRHCNYILNVSLVKSKSHATLKTILHILAKEDDSGLTLSLISEKMKRKPNIVLKQLNRLLATDLLIKTDRNYCFADPVIKQYMEIEELGIDLSLSDNLLSQVKPDLFEELEEKYLKASTQLGTAKESEIREMISGFNGQVVGGHLFGRDGTILLPRVDEASNFVDIDSNGDIFDENFVVEIDALVKGSENWLVEVKWKNKPSQPSDIDMLIRKKQFIEGIRNLNIDALWLISKNGFSEKTIDVAEANNVLLTDADDLYSIKKAVFRYKRKVM
ncbi:MAG: hypothetical protein C5S41_02435 [Candidatus Methanomarinus sp.]|jgi:hypothetical protein|nr:MAG: hypothetical protein C5S41_02435 [ANME-2 cluster archaeon]